MNTVTTSIQYGLQRIARFVESDLQDTQQELKESLELTIVKTVIDNYRHNAETGDYLDFLDAIVGYCADNS